MAKFKQKMLNGSDLAGFIKARQLRQSRRLWGLKNGVRPQLDIIKTVHEPAIEMYVNLKKRYGDDIEVDVNIHDIEMSRIEAKIKELNQDASSNAVIIQLPLAKPEKTSDILRMVAANKDVDGLNPDGSDYDAATATAILWLLNGYNVELRGKHILVVGQGKLVGAPVSKYLELSGLDVQRVDETVHNLAKEVAAADIIITATGQPELIKSDWIQPETVVVDAGVAGESGKIYTDVEAAARERNDITITPVKGGVGPLTVCALFENVLQAASRQ